MDVFLICPVRNVSIEELSMIKQYVKTLEQNKLSVYWPYRDTNQDDPIGNEICKSNREALTKAEEVHVWFSENSIGTIFDLGMAWALHKKIVLANDVPLTSQRSFATLLRWWEWNE